MTINYGLTVGLNELLDHESVAAQHKAIADGTNWQGTPLRPSAAGECERALAYSLESFWKIKAHPVEIKEPNVIRLLDLGHSVEWNLIGQIKRYLKEHFKIAYEQQCVSFTELRSEANPERNQFLAGNIDLTLTGKEFKCVADVKSKKEKYSSYRDSNWAEENEKYAGLPSVTVIGEAAFYVEDIEQFLKEVRDPFLAMNIYQLNLYTHSQFLKERGFNFCSLLYYNKNTSQLRELRFKPSEKLAQYVIDKFTRVFHLVDSGQTEEAKREFMPPSIKCAFCQYNKICWPETDALKVFFKSLPPKEWPKDTDRFPAGEELERLFYAYTQVCASEARATELEGEICTMLVEAGVRKVRFSDKSVYEVKWYKSPREGFRLKRSK